MRGQWFQSMMEHFLGTGTTVLSGKTIDISEPLDPAQCGRFNFWTTCHADAEGQQSAIERAQRLGGVAMKDSIRDRESKL
jgi:hypothetical protein